VGLLDADRLGQAPASYGLVDTRGHASSVCLFRMRETFRGSEFGRGLCALSSAAASSC